MNKRNTLTTGFAVIFLIMCALPALGESKAAAPDKVAMVNGIAIPKKVFDRQMLVFQARMAEQGQKPDAAQLENMKKHVLDQLIGGELLYQEAKKDGISVSTDEVNAYVANIKKRFPSEADFKQGLARMHTNEKEMLDEVGKSLVIQEFIKKHLLKGITIDDAEAKAFYDSHPQFFKEPEMVKARHILIKVSPTASQAEKDAAMKKIKDIEEKAKKGADFAELAKKYSEGPSAPSGGELGFFRRGQMVKPFEDAAFKLEPGQMSGIVKTQFGYHLIKVTAKKPAGTVSFEKAKDRIKENLLQRQSGQIVEEHVKKLAKTAKIEKFI
jgi:peptidyl-prolyl cis-trans isomerase C